jgi:hypothetical protein
MVPVSSRSPIFSASLGVRGPQRAGEAVFAVVHEADGLVVDFTFMMPMTGTEALFRHHAHGMIRRSQALAAPE